MKFELTILGTSSALPTTKRNPTAHLLNVNERFFLIDCGEGTQLQIRRFRLPLNKINEIFISHLHGDHIFGIFGLFSTLSLLGRTRELQVFAPPEFKEILDFYLKQFGVGNSFYIRHIPLSDKGMNQIYQNKILEVFSFPVVHRTPTWGFFFKEKPRLLNLKHGVVQEFGIPIAKIQEVKEGKDLVKEDGTILPNSHLTLPPYKNRSFAYVTDTRYLPEIVKYFMNVDLLYHEATFLQRDILRAEETHHSIAKQAAMIAKESNAKKLLIGHFSARYKNDDEFLDEAKIVFPNTILPKEGDTFSIDLEREERFFDGK